MRITHFLRSGSVVCLIYRQGAVESLDEDSPDEWVATVQGTEDYMVEVSLEDDKIMDYICDCPYEGDMCKHVVATLLTIRERKKIEKLFIPAEEKESRSEVFSSETVKAEIKEILAIADNKQLMSFLSEYAVHHIDFRNALKQQFIPDRNAESYCIYEIAELRDEFEMNAQPLSKVLERVEKELAGMDESDFGLFVPVSRKINLLYLLNRKEEAEATTLRYLFLPEIRNLWVDGLIDEEMYGEALSVLDEGICLERQKDQLSYVRNWVEKKLEIYQRMQDIPHVISTAKYLFLEKKGDLSYYRLLKQSVPAGEWKLFYNELIAQTPFPKSYWTSSVEADIYVEEGDFVRLVDFLRRNSSLEILLNYSHYLKEDYPEDLLERFSSQIQEYADKSTGRSHYEYVAKALKALLKLKGGAEEVCLLVDVFRQAYKRRRAMMEILKDF